MTKYLCGELAKKSRPIILRQFLLQVNNILFGTKDGIELTKNTAYTLFPLASLTAPSLFPATAPATSPGMFPIMNPSAPPLAPPIKLQNDPAGRPPRSAMPCSRSISSNTSPNCWLSACSLVCPCPCPCPVKKFHAQEYALCAPPAPAPGAAPGSASGSNSSSAGGFSVRGGGCRRRSRS